MHINACGPIELSDGFYPIITGDIIDNKPSIKCIGIKIKEKEKKTVRLKDHFSKFLKPTCPLILECPLRFSSLSLTDQLHHPPTLSCQGGLNKPGTHWE